MSTALEPVFNAPQRSLLARVKGWLGLGDGLEGSWRGPFIGIGEWGGAFELGPLEDGYQRNLSLAHLDARHIPAAYAAVMANARAVSQCYANHKRVGDRGKHEIVTTSPASRILRKPNSFETWPQFILNMVASLQFEGAAFAVVTRDERFAITSLQRLPRGTCSPFVEPTSGEIFYSIGSDPMDPARTDYIAPARDVLHLRQYCPRHPLLGESPIVAAAMAAGINVALSRSQLAFFSRMNRPSGVLSTDQALTREQMKELRAKFDEQSKLWAAGGLPILANGLKFAPISINSQDAQLIEAQRMSIADIARVYGVPLPVINELKDATLQNVEQLINLWLSISLGALLENIERSLDALFDLPRGEYIELDTAALLRTDFAGRIDALTKGITGGLFAPNEARAREGLPEVAEGDMPRVQQQQVPLDWVPPAPTPAPAPAPPADSGNQADKQHIENLEMRVDMLFLREPAAGPRGEKGDKGDPGPKGASGDAGPAGESVIGPEGKTGPAGRDGAGIDSPRWASAIYRAGTIVQHYFGQHFEALVDTAEEPGTGGQWRRVGSHGFRFRGPFESDRRYELGDITTENFTQRLWTGTEWLVFGYRGREGRKGERGIQGLMGPVGPAPRAVSFDDEMLTFELADGEVLLAPLPAYLRELRSLAEGDDDMPPLTRLVGGFDAGSTYRRGDVVRHGRALWVCRKSGPARILSESFVLALES